MEKKRYGKRVKIWVKAEILENGSTRTLFYSFPRNSTSHDRPYNVFYNLIDWFRIIFPEIDASNLIWSIVRFDEKEKEKMVSYIVQGKVKGEF